MMAELKFGPTTAELKFGPTTAELKFGPTTAELQVTAGVYDVCADDWMAWRTALSRS